jgi:hypothetical protein
MMIAFEFIPCLSADGNRRRYFLLRFRQSRLAMQKQNDTVMWATGAGGISLKLSHMPPRGSLIDRAKGLLTIYPRPRLADIKKRLADRDQLQASDTRTAAEKWLGDPPPHRSALAQRDRR